MRLQLYLKSLNGRVVGFFHGITEIENGQFFPLDVISGEMRR